MSVGTTGIIFGAIVAAWLAYLVPMMVRRHQAHGVEADPETRFSAVRIVRHGAGETSERATRERVRMSTPLTRRAAVEEIRRADRRAAGRRRNVLVVLVLAVVTLVALAIPGLVGWWTVAIPGGLIVVFLGIARVSVRTMQRTFDRRLKEIRTGENAEEDTVVVGEEETQAKQDKKREATVTSVELGAPVGRPGTLWDPLPITRPTYVSAPPAARTVRTIDLTAPQPLVLDNNPVVADAPEPSVTPVAELRPAVGD